VDTHLGFNSVILIFILVSLNFALDYYCDLIKMIYLILLGLLVIHSYDLIFLFMLMEIHIFFI
jgi:hypothetical protein